MINFELRKFSRPLVLASLALTAFAACNATTFQHVVPVPSLKVQPTQGEGVGSGSGHPGGLPQSALALASATGLTFDGVNVGSSLTKSLSILSLGALDLQGAGISIEGTGFTATHNCTSTIAIAQACDVSVTYAPTAPQNSAHGTLVASFANASSLTVTLEGSALGAALTLDAPITSFGSVAVGSSQAITYTIYNTGNAPAALSYGSLPPQVSRSGSCAEILNEQQTCSVILTFAPSDSSTISGSLNVSGLNLPFSGTGVTGPNFSISTTALDFGEVPVGSSSTLSFTVTNTGQVQLFGRQYPISGDTATFPRSGCAFPTNPLPGQSCVHDVTFTPMNAGQFSATITWSYGGVPPKTVTLTGRGI